MQIGQFRKRSQGLNRAKKPHITRGILCSQKGRLKNQKETPARCVGASIVHGFRVSLFARIAARARQEIDLVGEDFGAVSSNAIRIVPLRVMDASLDRNELTFCAVFGNGF